MSAFWRDWPKPVLNEMIRMNKIVALRFCNDNCRLAYQEDGDAGLVYGMGWEDIHRGNPFCAYCNAEL